MPPHAALPSRITDPAVTSAILAACGSASPPERAVGHNFKWDERLNPARVAAFEKDVAACGSEGFDALRTWFADYGPERLTWNGKDALPEPFQPTNDGAALSEAFGEDQGLVRLVRIRTPLRNAKLDVGTLQSAVKLVGAAKPEDQALPIQEARGQLDLFCSTWNKYDERWPAFVGLAEDVASDLAAPNWPARLRLRFGLGHIPSADEAWPIPVMVLRYTVGDVLKAAKHWTPAGDPFAAFRVPTVLESGANPYFFPAPLPLPTGRAANLAGGQNPDIRTRELIHLPIDLKPSYIMCVGFLDAHEAPPVTPEELVRLRDDHLECVRYDAERDGFGERMSDHAAG